MSQPANARQVGRFREYTFNGRSVLSVTTILSAIDKPGLRYWNAKMVAAAALSLMDKKQVQQLLDAATEAHQATKTHQTRHKNVCDFVPDALAWLAGVPNRIRDTAGERGSAVHEAAEADADLSDVPENARKAYGSYRRWVEEFQPIILAKEFQVFNDVVGYAGSGDLIAQIPWLDPDDVWLIDTKSSNSLHHEMRLQLRAYGDGEYVIDGSDVDEDTSQTLYRVNRFAILHVTDDGYEFVEVKAGPHESEVFRSALTILEWLRDVDNQPIGTVIAPPVAEAAA